jgi:hypothetical protein
MTHVRLHRHMCTAVQVSAAGKAQVALPHESKMHQSPIKGNIPNPKELQSISSAAASVKAYCTVAIATRRCFTFQSEVPL